MERTIKSYYEMTNYELNEEHLEHAQYVCLRLIVKCYKKDFSSSDNYDLESFLVHVKKNTKFTVFDTTKALCNLTAEKDFEKWKYLKQQFLSRVEASCTFAFLHESTKYPNWPVAGEIPRMSGRPASEKEIEMVNDMLSTNDEPSTEMKKALDIIFGDINSKVIFTEPGTVTFIKVPRKLKKKMKKEGAWNKPVMFEAEPLLSLNDLELIFKGNQK